ncbi:hypothetical protein Dimus_037874 [Dionaea muscipula]
MYVLSISVEDEFLQRIKDVKTPKEAWDTLATLFARTNDAQLQRLENELMSVSQGEMMISQYFNKVKTLCEEISKLDSQNPISETRTRRMIIHRLRPEFNGLVTTTRGWAKQPTLAELENILANQEALDKLLSGVTLKTEDKVLFINKRVGPQWKNNGLQTRENGESSRRKQSSWQGRQTGKISQLRRGPQQGGVQPQRNDGNKKNQPRNDTTVAREATMLVIAGISRRKGMLQHPPRKMVVTNMNEIFKRRFP